MSEEKESKGVKKKNVIDTLCECKLILLLKSICHQKVPSYSGIVVNLH